MKIKAYSVKEEAALKDAKRRLAKARADRIGTAEFLAAAIESANANCEQALKKARAALPLEKISDALESVNGRATAHTFTTANEVREVAKIAEDQLAASGVPLAERSGCTITATSGDAVANRYKNRRIATRVTLVRGSGAWYLTEIATTEIYPSGPAKPSIKLTDKAREAVMRAALAPYAG